jgi:pimeloyl-ACP methyl ester carboxylesterase
MEYREDRIMSIQTEAGGTISVYIDGPQKGEPIVLVHGHGADHRMWEPQLRRYAERGYRVIAPDMRGHGSSSKVEEIEIGDWAEDIRFILDRIGVEKAHVIGVSMGGIIAGEFVCRYPERTLSVVLSDTFGKLRSIKEKSMGFFIVIGFRFMRLLSRGKVAEYYAGAYDFPGGEDAARYFSTAAKTIDFDQLIITRKAINRVDIEERLAALRESGKDTPLRHSSEDTSRGNLFPSRASEAPPAASERRPDTKNHPPGTSDRQPHSETHSLRFSELSAGSNGTIPSLVMVGTRPGKFFVDFSRRLADSLGCQPVLLEGALDPSNLTATEEFDRHVLSFVAADHGRTV